jgi:hypothetical protein
MGLIPEPRSLMALGVTRLLQGLRTGDQRALLLGAALAAFGWWRNSAAPKKELLKRTVVAKGSSVVVRNATDQPGVEIRRVDRRAT